MMAIVAKSVWTKCQEERKQWYTQKKKSTTLIGIYMYPRELYGGLAWLYNYMEGNFTKAHDLLLN